MRLSDNEFVHATLRQITEIARAGLFMTHSGLLPMTFVSKQVPYWLSQNILLLRHPEERQPTNRHVTRPFRGVFWLGTVPKEMLGSAPKGFES